MRRIRQPSWEVLRSADDPDEVFIYHEFSSLDEANEARARIVSSGVLDRFGDKHAKAT